MAKESIKESAYASGLSNSKGYVYVLSNPSMPGLVKIGKSMHGGRQRAAQLFQTGVATPFVLEFEIMSEWCGSLEADVHSELSKYRESENREFFRVDVGKAITAILKWRARDLEHEVLDSESASVVHDAMILCWEHNIATGDFFDSIGCLSEFAIRQAIIERSKRREAFKKRVAEGFIF